MKTPNLKCEYDNDGERITAPGKFEGEPVFAPHFWELGMNGLADEDGSLFKFKLDETDLSNAGTNPFWHELKTWLGRKRTLFMSEDSHGFVHCF